MKSGYYLDTESKRNRLHIGESSNQSANSWLWRKLWQLKVPPKVKTFLWRACREVLPVKEKLSRKGIDNSQLCPAYNEEVESVMHALVLCPAAKIAWFASPLCLRSERIVAHSFFGWFGELVRQLDDQ